MNANLLAIVNRIVAEQGEGILAEPRRITAFFADLAKDEPKPQKNALVKCLEHGFAQTLKNVTEPDRVLCKQQLAQKLHDEEGLDPGLCEETVELLAAVLFADEQKKKDNLCKNCGKELQEEWKMCPFCSTQVVSQTLDMNSTVTQTNEGNIHNSQLMKELENTKSVNSQLNDELGNIKNSNSQLQEKFKKIKSGLTAAIWLGILGTAISIIVGGSSYSDMKSAYNTKSWQYNDVKTKYDKLLADYEKSKSLWKIEITSIKVGNTDKDSRWFTMPGESLSSAQMRYLKPVITYDSIVSEDVTFYVKIINPYGYLSNNASISPSGFTNSTTARVNRGTGQSLDLSGWGSSDSSIYAAGTWTVEVWYNDMCLMKSEKVVIGP